MSSIDDKQICQDKKKFHTNIAQNQLTGIAKVDLNHNQNWICSINQYKEKNDFGIEQLFGNCWEWCSNDYYPYDGFIPDPLYRSYSYPHFGNKKICKGGSWATNKHLITPSFRKSQYATSRKEYIGFRVVKYIN